MTPSRVARLRRALGVIAVVVLCSLLSTGCVFRSGSKHDAGIGATTSVAVRSSAAIELRGDGLGVVELGAAPDVAIAAVSAALGQPTADTGWQSASSAYGTCPGTQVRGVEWDHLVLLFTDGATPYGRSQHLFSWRLTGAPPALGTAKGLGYKATVADAQELYPGEVEVTPPQDPFPGFVTIKLPGGPITGYLEGDVLTNLEAGAPCGE